MAKLADLEERYGITVEWVESAYSSQECARCGYVDAKNRASQAAFACRWCGHATPADGNAARVLRQLHHGRSVVATGARAARGRSTRRRREALRDTLVREFVARQPRPRGRPADPRSSNPYFAAWWATHGPSAAAVT